MATLLGSLRRLAVAPSLHSVGFAGRGFPVEPGPVGRRLERIPQSVVCGFEWGIDSSGPAELERRIALLDPDLHGFAYEGATMAAVVLDAMAGFRTSRTKQLLLGPARPHLLLAYIGVGFAMGRLPRPLWSKVLPDLDGVPHHPTMSWLAVDGYAFDRAYFDTRRWVDQQYRPRGYPWRGRPDYFLRGVDHGVGRALWFIHAAGVQQVIEAVERFPADRHADLWAGVGLAAAFAGGAGPAELRRLRRAAGEHAAHLGVGAVFAATARTLAGTIPEHTGEATRALAGLDVEHAEALATATAVGEEEGTPRAPAYEIWRTRIRAQISGTGLLEAA